MCLSKIGDTPKNCFGQNDVLGLSERWMFGFSVAFPDFLASRFEGHIAISELQHFPLEVDGSATLRDEGFDGKYHEIICIYFVYYIILYVYIYILCKL